MGVTDSGAHIPARRIDEKALAENERRPMSGTFDRLVEVNLRLTDQVRALVRALWVFMALLVILRIVEFRLTGH